MRILDTVALRRDLPEHNLPAGLVGVIVEAWVPGFLKSSFLIWRDGLTPWLPSPPRTCCRCAILWLKRRSLDL